MRKSTLSGRVAVVTGASSGIGRATAVALARHGSNVALAARRESMLRKVQEEIAALGREALVLPTDVTRRHEVDQMVAKTLGRWGQIDILVANAGAYIRSPVKDLTVEDMKRSMSVNFYGVLYAILAVQSHLLEQGCGHIVLVSSMDAKKGLPLDAPYVAAKSAMAGYGQVLRQELAPRGVDVTLVYPGRVDTALIDSLEVPWVSSKISPEAVAEAIVAAIHHKRAEVIVPFQARLLHLVDAICPRLGDWFVRVLSLEGWEKEATGADEVR